MCNTMIFNSIITNWLSPRFTSYPCKSSRYQLPKNRKCIQDHTRSQDQTLLRRRMVANNSMVAESRSFSSEQANNAAMTTPATATATTTTATTCMSSTECPVAGVEMGVSGAGDVAGFRPSYEHIDDEILINEWEKCARAVDRLFFWLFTAMSVLALANVFAPISW